MIRAKVTDEGVVVPRQFFAAADTEVEISEENGMVVLRPVKQPDPIYELGVNPVTCGIPNASDGHDQYLTDGPQ